MIIKKYLVNKDSVFSKSIILPFYEEDGGLFKVDGFVGFNIKNLFNFFSIKRVGKNNDIDYKTIATNLVVVYLNELNEIMCLILENNHKFYSFRVDPQKKDVLKIQSNYISSNLEELTKDFETSGSRRKSYVGLGNFEDIKDINYFENLYGNPRNFHKKEKTNLYKLDFLSSSVYITEFTRLFERKEIKIPNEYLEKEISLNLLAKLTNSRLDSLFINVDSLNIEYIIYTTKPRLINRYFLLKRIDESTFELLDKSISYNKLLTEIDRSFNRCNQSFSKALINISFNDLTARFKEFLEDEEFDKSLNNDVLEIESSNISKDVDKQIKLPKEVMNILDKYRCSFVDGYLYFKEHEVFPLGFVHKNSINLCESRDVNKEPSVKVINLNDKNKIEASINELLNNKPSSRLLILEELVNKIVKTFYSGSEEQKMLIEEINNNYKFLWKSDKEGYQRRYASNIMEKFSKWQASNKDKLAKGFKSISEVETNEDVHVGVSLHASVRISERIKDMSMEEKIKLANIAYQEGKTAWHYFDSQSDDFKVLQYLQSKHYDREIRLYKGVVFVFQRKEPHNLITCLSYEESFKNFMSHQKR